MNNHFPRILTLLRKERGQSQKDAAAGLGISQALLSHYEKGIRECGLSFVVKVAEYYEVSCDYLLGLSPHRSGATLRVEDLPDTDAPKRRKDPSPELPERKLLSNALSLLYRLLQECGNKPLTDEVSAYLFLAFYRAFRTLYSCNPKNPQGLFTATQSLSPGLAAAAMNMTLTAAQCLAAGEAVGDLRGLAKDKLPQWSPEKLSQAYPNFSPALFAVLQQAESHFAFPQGLL